MVVQEAERGHQQERASTHEDGALLPATGHRPRLRGWSHAVAAVVAPILTVVAVARGHGDLARLVPLLVYGASLTEQYAVSAIFHLRTWRFAWWRRLRTLDHASIFVAIAATYTPLCLQMLGGPAREAVVAGIWLLAVAGVALKVGHPGLPRGLSTGLYVGVGSVGAIALYAWPAPVASSATAGLVWLAIAGILYLGAACTYWRRWPNPFPRVFGYHEVFHLVVIAGSGAVAIAVWSGI
jgi:hemolysin III